MFVFCSFAATWCWANNPKHWWKDSAWPGWTLHQSCTDRWVSSQTSDLGSGSSSYPELVFVKWLKDSKWTKTCFIFITSCTHMQCRQCGAIHEEIIPLNGLFKKKIGPKDSPNLFVSLLEQLIINTWQVSCKSDHVSTLCTKNIHQFHHITVVNNTFLCTKSIRNMVEIIKWATWSKLSLTWECVILSASNWIAYSLTQLALLVALTDAISCDWEVFYISCLYPYL